MKNPGVHRTGFEPTTVALRKLHTDALTIQPWRRRYSVTYFLEFKLRQQGYTWVFCDIAHTGNEIVWILK